MPRFPPRNDRDALDDVPTPRFHGAADIVKSRGTFRDGSPFADCDAGAAQRCRREV
jgi:hypothetical protein